MPKENIPHMTLPEYTGCLGVLTMAILTLATGTALMLPDKKDVNLDSLQRKNAPPTYVAPNSETESLNNSSELIVDHKNLMQAVIGQVHKNLGPEYKVTDSNQYFWGSHTDKILAGQKLPTQNSNEMQAISGSLFLGNIFIESSDGQTNHWRVYLNETDVDQTNIPKMQEIFNEISIINLLAREEGDEDGKIVLYTVVFILEGEQY